MKPFIHFISLLITAIFMVACDNHTPTPAQHRNTQDSTASHATEDKFDLFKDEEERLKARRNLVFKTILDSASRANKTTLVSKLKETYRPTLPHAMELTICKNTYMYGYSDSLWIVELKALDDNLCHPYGLRRQFIFDAAGHLIYEDSATQVEFVKIWKEKSPLLMTLNSDCKGRGQHHFYKYESGQLIDIFNVLLETTPLTYDEQKSDDYAIFQPAVLTLSVVDKNGDGRNDLVFSGQRLLLKGPDNKQYTESAPYKREKVEYVFLYEPGEDWFIKH